MKKHPSRTQKQPKVVNSIGNVFVLPPELLAKFGINLVTIQEPQITSPILQPTSSRIKETEQNIDHSISNDLIENEHPSSIIETANLMKESVFLSPTFFHTPAVSAPYEDEPISNGDTIVETNNMSSEPNSPPYQCGRSELVSEANIGIQQSISKLAKDRNTSEEKLVEQTTLISADKSTHNKAKDLVPTDKISAKSLVDDHADEAYLSDFSNSYPGCSPESTSSEANKQKLLKNKVISNVDDDLHSNNTEIEDMDVVRLPSDVVSDPVIMESENIETQNGKHTAETEKETDDVTTAKPNSIDEPATTSNSENNVLSQCTHEVEQAAMNEKANVDPFKLKVQDSFENGAVKNTRQVLKAPSILVASQEELSLTPVNVSSSTPMDLNNCEKNSMSIDNTSKENTPVAEARNNTVDKVKEIATYLSQIANERNNKIRMKSKNKDKEMNMDPTMLKICIQGEEEPGGQVISEESLDILKVSKTYQKSVRNGKNRMMIKPDIITIPDSFQLTDDTNIRQVGSTEVRDLEHQNEFCICFDFGNFTYYDCEMLYEHIHFCLHNNVNCDSETLYGIYNDDIVLRRSVDCVEDNPREVPTNEHNDVDTIETRLCWNEINSNSDYNNDANNTKLSSVNNGRSALEIVKDKHTDLSTTLNASKDAELAQILKRDSDSLKKIRNSKYDIEKFSKDKCKNKPPDKTLNSSIIAIDESLKPLNKSSKNNEYNIVKPIEDREKHTNKAIDKSFKSVNLSDKNNKDSVEKVIKGKEKCMNKPIDETPNLSNKVLDETSKALKKSSENNENAIEKRDESTIKAPDDTPNLSNKAIDASSKALKRSLSKRKSSANTTDSLHNEHEKTASDNNNVTITTSRSTRSSMSRSSKSNSVDNEDMGSQTKKLSNDVTNISSKLFVGSDTESPQQSEKTAKTNIQSQYEQKSKVSKKGKRPSNTITTDSPTKKAKIAPSNSDEKSVRRTRSARVSKENNTNNAAKEKNKQGESADSYNMAETRTSDIQVVQNASAYVTKIEPENSDDEILYEVSIIPDTNETQATETSERSEETEMMYEVSVISEITMNQTEPSELASSMMVDSTIKDTTFDDTQPIEFSTPLVQGSSKSVKCAVCGTCMKKSQWNEHMWKEHNYLAWREGDTPLDLEDDDLLRIHIQAISNKNGGLECSKCNVKRKHAKPFLRHIQTCSQPEAETTADQTETTEEIATTVDTDKPIKKSRSKIPIPPFTCAVCNESVERSDWIEHIQINHNYLAWTTDEQPLDLENEAEVKEHLRYISKYNGGLKCHTCGSQWAYAKKFLDHKCEKRAVDIYHGEVTLDLPDFVTCGICNLDVRGIDWINHIQLAHEYMAWMVGQTPLDPNNPDAVKAHLDTIVKFAGELICTRCGERRRTTYAYLQHHTACINSGFNFALEINGPDKPVDKDQYLCGVCHDIGHVSKWRNHAMTKHYNIAWRVGDVPINLRNPYAVEKYLKVYQKKRGLTCLQCNESRTSCFGFYAHILTCGRTPEEMEGVLNDCEICNKKYLCVYRNQHMAWHRDSDMRREKRESMAKKAEEEAKNPPQADLLPMGKRRAAEKAKKVIKNHTSNMIDGKPVCGCGAIFQDAAEYAEHSCNRKGDDDGDESDESVKMEGEDIASDDDEYAMIDSGVSDEETDVPKKRIRHRPDNNKVHRLQYKIENYDSYLAEAYKDFATTHYTGESLFNIWRNSAYTIVPAEERDKYLPELTESCKIMIGKEEANWTTYKRFEARKLVFSFFTGGAISCISWAPPNLNDETLSIYLAVSTHRGPDVPRHSAGERPVHPGLLQIWDFGDFEAAPYCALTLAHEYGIVWSIDWCPSGARDGPAPLVPHKCRLEATPSRLGLLALACSNGSVYILAVPVPPSHEHREEPPMYKLTPVAELRLAMTPERRVYQATSVKWSPQKGHSVIIVGYSDGTTALFDLNTESPFLATMEDGVTVYFPFQERRSESTSITSVGVLTTTNESCAVGGQFSTSMTGGTLSGRASRPSARTHVATSGALHAASWPAVALSGDLPFMRASCELEWWGCGRRVGAARAWAACARCACAASAAVPAVKLHQQHPVYPEIKKLIGALLVMTPLQKKSKKKTNDDLSVVVEPLTYHDAAAKYGLQLYTIPKKRSAQLLAHQICNKDEFRPERFPLSDIVAMAFCPSDRHHDRLALATHTGFVFVIHA